MPISPVQSIRVAANLAERFGVLLSLGPTTVAEFELRIGEAQQLYPEIWRHLDDARAALAEAGRDITSYDHLRKDELAQLGVTNIESTTSLDYAGLLAGQLGTVQFKTASFNEAGHRRALAACRALMAAMPEVDWKAVEHEEGREMRAAGSLQGAKWKHTGKAIVIGAALVGFGVIFARVLASGDKPPAAATPTAKPAVDRVQQLRILELRDQFALTCYPEHRQQLANALRATSQDAEARKVETEPCVRAQPASCDALYDAIAERLARQFELVKDNAWELSCIDTLVAGARLEHAFLVVVSAHDKRHTSRVLRGVISPDGARDVIDFGPAPGTRLVSVIDLDLDGSDEVVFADTTSLTASRITAQGFQDIEGPPLPGCPVGRYVNVAGGNVPPHVVIQMPERVPEKGCPASGAHHYYLARDGHWETR